MTPDLTVHSRNGRRDGEDDETPGFASLRVMVIDDDAFILRTTSLLLNRLGVADVITAEGGAEALTKLRDDAPHPNIVLTDLSMPDVDGMGVIRGLADLRFTGGVGLISGNEERDLDSVRQVAEARELRVVGVVSKPVGADALTELLEAFFDGPAPQDVTSEDAGPSDEDLGEALALGHIVPFYQPIIRSDADSMSIYGVEALARWKHPTRGLIGPNYFIPIAEQSGRVKQLTLRIIEQSLHDMQSWKQVPLTPTMSINIAVASLDADDDFFGTLCKLTEHYNIDPKDVILELTERQVMTNVADAVESLTRLRMHGFQLAIDDFGTGYSSMQQLQRVPFTELKVDRAFVHQADKKSSALAILNTSISLGRALSMSMVAEGVETEEDLDTVTSAGIELIQGYLFARPMPVEEFTTWAVEFNREHGHD